MIAIKAKFDGKKIILPKDSIPREAQDVVVVFEDAGDNIVNDDIAWRAASASALRKVWDNDADAIYDKL